MNERIKHLAEQAGLYDFVLEAMGLHEEFNQFAHLLIDECAKKCEQEPGLKYSPNTASAMIGCKERILALKD